MQEKTEKSAIARACMHLKKELKSYFVYRDHLKPREYTNVCEGGRGIVKRKRETRIKRVHARVCVQKIRIGPQLNL